MYLDDPREQQIDINNHTVWEEDNRIEIRYQWGAAVWDLCNMDPKDYNTTIFYTKTAGEELINNNLTATIKDENVTVTFPYSPISDIYIVAKDSDGKKETISLPAGSTSPYYTSFSVVTGPKVSSLCIGPTEESALTPTFSDGTYKYTIIKKVQTDAICKFAIIENSKIGSITPSVLKPLLKDAALSGTTTEFDYVIPFSGISNYNNMTESECENIRNKSAYRLLFLTTTSIDKIYMADKYEQNNMWDVDASSITIDGVTYKMSIFKNPVANIYDTDPEVHQYGKNIILKYKIVIKEY